MQAPATQPGGDEAHVAFDDVHMAFGGRRVLRGLSCHFPAGRISVILGGSGSGKSTLLKLIAGLVRPQAGRITVAGEEITRLSERGLQEVRGKLGMMFQGGALLDSMTVFDNLALSLREHRGLPESEVAEAVRACLAAVGVVNAEGLLPGQLSGGMTKRVALARAILMHPRILLCDEPFSGLDPISSRRIESLLVGINRSTATTMIVVSHHIASTMRMASNVLILLPDGAVEGSPEELRRRSDPRILSFLNEDVDESHADTDAPVEFLPVNANRAV
jgi:phospholipid/cholesterol/gamma-HCH transport system ATP-binding protein